jgi:hypothetical protein
MGNSVEKDQDRTQNFPICFKECGGCFLPIERIKTEYVLADYYGGGRGYEKVLGTEKIWKCSRCGREVK